MSPMPTTIAGFLIVHAILEAAALAQCGPGGCPPPGTCGPNGCYLGGRNESGGSPAPAATPLPGRCRIAVGDGSWGSGTLIDECADRSLVLTCAHLFDDGNSSIVCYFPSGRSFSGVLVDLDRHNDLAVVAIRPTGLAPVAVEENEPTGELVAGGFGPYGVFAAVRGQVVAQSTRAGASHPSAVMQGGVRLGDSGGAVVDSQRRLVGVVWGCAGGQTYFTCGRPLRDFLARVRARVGVFATPHASGPSAPSGPRPSTLDPRPSCEEQLNALSGRVERLAEAVANTPTGPPGPPGLQGERGPQGPPGADGQPGEHAPRVDTSQFATREELAAAAASRVAQFGLSHLFGAIGLSTGLAGIAAWIGGRMARRAVTRIAHAHSGSAPSGPRPSTDAQPIAVDTPPPPQRTVPETHFVSVEKDTFAKAHQWASEHVARKYPGATEVLAAQESLIKQYIAGR